MPLKIVIIGGVAAGMSAATRARRINELASITVLEKSGFVSFANCGLPYYLAGRIAGREKLLVTTPQRLRQRFNIDARVNHEVTGIDRAKKVVEGIDNATGKPFSLPYDKLILAPGASAIVPPIDHVRAPNVFLLRSVEDTLAIETWIRERSPRSAAIVGAGFIGLEMAEALRDRGLAVTLVEKAPHALPPLDAELAGTVEKELAAHEVRLVVGTGLKALGTNDAREGEAPPEPDAKPKEGSGGASPSRARLVTHVELEDGQSIPADMVLLSIGVRPNVRLAQEAGIVIGATGAIAVDQYQRTNDPDIYAAGDVAEVTHGVTGKTARIPLAGPANRQGRAAGEHAARASGSATPAGKVLGTAIVQVFGLSVGITGLGESAARAARFDVATAYVFPGHHAGYYPGAQPMRLKLIYDNKSGKVLGAQAVGPAGIDKRIDVVATVLHFGGTIDDLAQLDLTYAPQFSSAKDPVHLAAFVAQNQRAGLVQPAPADVHPAEGETILDVRTAAEVAAGSVPGAVNIPVDELRQRLGELDKARPVLVFCQVGLRGYIASRILKQNGFARVRNVQGGWTLMSGRS